MKRENCARSLSFSHLFALLKNSLSIIFFNPLRVFPEQNFFAIHKRTSSLDDKLFELIHPQEKSKVKRIQDYQVILKVHTQ